MRHSKFTAERLSCSSVFIVLPLKFLEFIYVIGSSKFFTAQVSGVCLCFWFFKVFHCCYSAVCTLSAPVSFFPFPASESWLVSPCSGQDQGPGRPWVRLRLLASQSQPGSSASGVRRPSVARALHVSFLHFCVLRFKWVCNSESVFSLQGREAVQTLPSQGLGPCPGRVIESQTLQQCPNREASAHGLTKSGRKQAHE